jgi:hypothetical protein
VPFGAEAGGRYRSGMALLRRRRPEPDPGADESTQPRKVSTPAAESPFEWLPPPPGGTRRNTGRDSTADMWIPDDVRAAMQATAPAKAKAASGLEPEPEPTPAPEPGASAPREPEPEPSSAPPASRRDSFVAMGPAPQVAEGIRLHEGRKPPLLGAGAATAVRIVLFASVFVAIAGAPLAMTRRTSCIDDKRFERHWKLVAPFSADSPPRGCTSESGATVMLEGLGLK